MRRLIRFDTAGVLAIATALTTLCGATARAHDGHENEDPHSPRLTLSQRTWTHASGHFHVHGSFVATHGDQVQVRKEDGGLIDIKLGALSDPDRAWVEERVGKIRRVNSGRDLLLLAQGPAARAGSDGQGPAPSILAAFKPFEDKLKLRWDRDFFYVESNGIPDHQMMVGITAWQQQVPLPQKYTGDSAWRIPLHPVVAKQPMSAKENFFRGAIALAVNGIPIFNPIKNDGHTDTLIAGELDEWGGHCGRADDYHYHIAPLHLEPKLGNGKALGYALDGYPVYGYDEPDGSKVQRLDVFNGHEDAQKNYHYHATKNYPYLNGGFHGEVTERDGQVDPQPRANGVREALPPLRGAKITAFSSPKPGSYSLTYEIRGQENFVNYTINPNGTVAFQFVDSAGRTTAATYQERERGTGGRPGGARDGDRPPPRGENGRPPGPEGGRRPPPVFSALDLNGDRELSADEIAKAPQSLLTLDVNKDGSVTNDEMRPPRPSGDDNPPQKKARPRQGGGDNPPQKKARPGQGEAAKKAQRPPPPEVSAIDLNNDGDFSAQEIAQSSRSLLKLDSDKDGKLSDEELRPGPPPDEPPPGEGRRRPQEAPAAGGQAQADRTLQPEDFGPLVVSSPAFAHGGRYPVDFTCDGAGVSPPIEWKEVPQGTKSFALTLWHVPPPGGVKSYWVLYNIPASVTSLPRAVKGIGVSGLNDKRRTDYDPMCSQGPGVKTYHITVYALAKELELPPGRATRAELLSAIADVKLSQKTLTYQYERSGRE